MVVKEIRVINTKEISFENPISKIGSGLFPYSFASDFFSLVVSPFLCCLGPRKCGLGASKKMIHSCAILEQESAVFAIFVRSWSKKVRSWSKKENDLFLCRSAVFAIPVQLSY